MSSSPTPSYDLYAIARRAAAELGFATDIPEAVIEEVAASRAKPVSESTTEVRDMRELLWSSIDNLESRDLDQLEYATLEADGEIRVLIAIADVDAFVPQGLPTDSHAAQNTTSLYLGVTVFPMLPGELSNDETSLLEAADRLAVVVEFFVTDTGSVRTGSVFRALVRNQAKLEYDSTGEWLDGKASIPNGVARVPGLEDQVQVQNEARKRLHSFRRESGALEFESSEARPVTADGQVVGLQLTQKNRARELIESFMVAANSAIASTLGAKGAVMIQRVVRTPKRWERIVTIAKDLGTTLPPEPNSKALADFLALRRKVDRDHFPELSLAIVKLLGPGEYVVLRPGATHEGHFGLAVSDYTHSTAPNRRYVDLVTQRLIKAALLGKLAPYLEAELQKIAEHCNERANTARKLERFMRKAAAAVLLSGHIGETFEGIVTGAGPKGTYIRLVAPPAEGRIVQGEHGLDVGDKVQVRLLRTDPMQGFIDFERMNP